MNTLAEIEEAVRRLSRSQRRQLFDWFAGVLDLELGVCEPVARYGGAAERYESFTLEEYLDLEARSSIQHEFVAGEIYDMADPSQDHDIIAMNIAAPLHAHVRGRPCRVYVGRRQLHFRIGQDEFVYRPDVWLACGEARDSKGKYLDEPRLVIEVLSPSTARFDRREKAASYREIPSIEEYVVVAPKPADVVIYRRAQQWKPEAVAAPDGVLELQSVGLTLSLECIYERVRGETPP